MFTTDSRVENFLTQMGVKWEYVNGILFTLLDDNWRIENMARPVAVREDAVLEYFALMESGSAAPAPILHFPKDKYFLLDGVQRVSAEELTGATRFSGYVVTCDSEDMLAAVRVLSNARLQGRAESAEWTRKRAVEILVIQRGLSVKEVALMGGWKPADVERTAKVIDWGFKIRSAGGPVLADNMIELVSRHMNESDLNAASKPIAEFLSTLKTGKFSRDDAEPHVADFFSKITKTSKLHAIYKARTATFLDLPEVQVRLTGRRGTGVAKDVTLRRMLKSAVTVVDEIIAEKGEVPYVDEFFKLLKQINGKLRDVSSNPQAVTAATPADKWSGNAQD